MTIHKIHPMFTFREKDADMKDCIRIGSEKAHRIPENIYGNFFEHLGSQYSEVYGRKYWQTLYFMENII